MNLLHQLTAGALLAAAAALPVQAQTADSTRQQPAPAGVEFRPEASVGVPMPKQPAEMDSSSKAASEVDWAKRAAAKSDAKQGEAGEDATIEESAILPSAGGQQTSRAPSMDLDCEKNPKECLELLKTDTTQPSLSAPPTR